MSATKEGRELGFSVVLVALEIGLICGHLGMDADPLTRTNTAPLRVNHYVKA